MSAEEEKEKLSSLVAKLRDVFPFPEEKDYDKGYDWNKKDGWHLAAIIGSPIMCLETMIGVCEGMKADEITEPNINYNVIKSLPLTGKRLEILQKTYNRLLSQEPTKL